MPTHTARVSRLIHAQPREVWSALTTPSRIKAFLFGADTETDWTVGSPIKFTGVMGGREYEDVGEILSFEPDEQLAYTHWSSTSDLPHVPDNEDIVCFDLEPDGESTLVTITQSRRTDARPEADAGERERVAQMWNAALAALASMVESGVPRPHPIDIGGRG